MDSLDSLLTCYQVGRRLGWSTDTVKRAARGGRLPGAVFLPAGRRGMHIKFDPAKLERFGGLRPIPPSPVAISRVKGTRAHASRGLNGVTADGNAKRRGRARTMAETRAEERITAQPNLRDYIPTSNRVN